MSKPLSYYEEQAQAGRARLTPLLLRAICAELGPGWAPMSVKTSDDWGTLEGIIRDFPRAREATIHNGVTVIAINAGEYGTEGKFGLRGMLPADHRAYYTDRHPAGPINVASTKTAKQIASEITRRLLPEYEPRLSECLNRRTEVLAISRAAHAHADALIAASGGRYRKIDTTPFATEIPLQGKGLPDLRVYEGSARVDTFSSFPTRVISALVTAILEEEATGS